MAGEYSVTEQGWRVAAPAMAINRLLAMAGADCELAQNEDGVWQVVTTDYLWAIAYRDTWPFEPWPEAPVCPLPEYVWVYNGPDGP